MGVRAYNPYMDDRWETGKKRTAYDSMYPSGYSDTVIVSRLPNSPMSETRLFYYQSHIDTFRLICIRAPNWPPCVRPLDIFARAAYL